MQAPRASLVLPWYTFDAMDIDEDTRTKLEAVREQVYGMPYDEWKAKHQTGPKV